MKLRRLPEDFQVEELTDIRPSAGPFALYRLEKRSIGTPEAVQALLERWQIPRARVSYGGLKDRHAVTVQHLAIRHGPRRDLREKSFAVRYLGPVPREFGPADIRANRFRIVLRDLGPEEVQRASRGLAEVPLCGLPNYFDDQRFGSLGASGEFIAQPWCLGNYERAVWLALADAHPHDPPEERDQKTLLRTHWGDWARCKALLARSHRRSVVTYLVDHPTDFRGALARLRVDLRSLYLAAFQSALWNRLLDHTLRRVCRSDQLVDVPLKLGPVPFFRTLDPPQVAELRDLELPLPAARQKVPPGPLADLIAAVAAEYGLEPHQIRVKYPRDSFFSNGTRRAWAQPQGLQGAFREDELYPGRSRLDLAFDLARGVYATILVKRLTEVE